MNEKMISCISLITASKMYKSSTRKSKILAAIKNPINVSLVEQLAEYVDEEYQYLLDEQPVEDEDVSVDSELADEPEVDDVGDDVPEPSAPTGGAPIREPLAEKYADELSGSPDDIPDVPPADSEQPEKVDGTEAATAIQGKPVMADTSVVPEESSVTLAGVAGEIRGMLNARIDTAGVVRVSVKKADEVWVYYNDDINLNTVMEPVIRLLGAANYAYLTFNRLARTDNAIVFVINTNQAG